MAELKTVNSPARVVVAGDAGVVVGVVVAADVVDDVVGDPEQAEPANRASDTPAMKNGRY